MRSEFEAEVRAEQELKYQNGKNGTQPIGRLSSGISQNKVNPSISRLCLSSRKYNKYEDKRTLILNEK